jgi:tetraacyldisaccharide 4'-kinase
MLPPESPVLRAELEQDTGLAEICGRRVFAFAGIAYPEKFFTGLERAGVTVVGRVAFADHHPYATSELAGLVRRAEAMDAVLVTTPKDAVRLPAASGVHVVGVRLVWENAAAIESLLDVLVGARDQIQRHRIGNGPPLTT